MMKILSILFLIVASTTSSVINNGPTVILAHRNVSALGVVSPIYRCGGAGTTIQLRISDCEGHCSLIPGTVYNCEMDFMPSTLIYPGLNLKVEICLGSGYCMTFLDVDIHTSPGIPNPGFIYTAHYSIVPDDFLSGQTSEFRAYLSHMNSGLQEICMAMDITIL